ncbi:hypothetical protein, partial [Microvirga solisilvae]|uniref:hypothetical protein n=1 Tax=Microvirga solisilvae TaxID=2919498 RepID=UPI001FB00769
MSEAALSGLPKLIDDSTEGLTQNLTAGVDNLSGTEAADTFVTQRTDLNTGDEIRGGGGTDTLQLNGVGDFDLHRISMDSIEVIRGSDAWDTIKLNGSQLAGIMTIDGGGGGYNTLTLHGDECDLTGKVIEGFDIFFGSENQTIKVDNLATASLIVGSEHLTDHLFVEGIVLSEAQLQTLFDQGIDRITDASGEMYENTAPTLANLDGDHVTLSPSGKSRIDVGMNSLLTDDDGLEILIVELTAGDLTHVLGIDVAGTRVTFPEGIGGGKPVHVDGTRIGELAWLSGADMGFAFEPAAEPEFVSQIIRAITLTSTATDENHTSSGAIKVTTHDTGHRFATATVTFDVGPETTNSAPDVSVEPGRESTDAVDNGPLKNPFGGLVFADDEKDVLTVTISFDASHGDLVIPLGLATPGFEEKDGKKIYTFTGRPDSLAIIMDVLQFDAAERPLAEAGSHHVTEFTIGVTDEDHATPDTVVVRVDTVVANRAPSNITLSKDTVSEIVGGEVGILSATDQDNATFSYELINSAGGRFA